jgi:hypothetical protein
MVMLIIYTTRLNISTWEVYLLTVYIYIFIGATAPIWALAYLHETLRFTSVFF